MQHPGTDTGSFGPHWGKKEHAASMRVPLMTRTEVSNSPGNLVSQGNPVSYIQADASGNMSSVLTG